jgi:hypothetical protein
MQTEIQRRDKLTGKPVNSVTGRISPVNLNITMMAMMIMKTAHEVEFMIFDRFSLDHEIPSDVHSSFHEVRH